MQYICTQTARQTAESYIAAMALKIVTMAIKRSIDLVRQHATKHSMKSTMLFTLTLLNTCFYDHLYANETSREDKRTLLEQVNSRDVMVASTSMDSDEEIAELKNPSLTEELLAEVIKSETSVKLRFATPLQIVLSSDDPSLKAAPPISDLRTLTFDTAIEAKFFTELLAYLSESHKITLLNNGWTFLIDDSFLVHATDIFSLVIANHSTEPHRAYHAAIDTIAEVQNRKGEFIPLMGTYPPNELDKPSITRDSLIKTTTHVAEQIARQISSGDFHNIEPNNFVFRTKHQSAIENSLQAFITHFSDPRQENKSLIMKKFRMSLDQIVRHATKPPSHLGEKASSHLGAKASVPEKFFTLKKCGDYLSQVFRRKE